MNLPQTSLVRVYLWKEKDKIFVGQLVLSHRKIFFEYQQSFIQTELALSPFKLPLKAGLIRCEDLVFEGLFGVFNDSLPDGWGRLLLDRKLKKIGLNPGDLSPLDRLCYVGSGGMGALTYEPEITGPVRLPHPFLDEISNEIYQFQNDNDEFVDDLLALNGSSAGARPKALLQIDQTDWIVKFRSSVDPKDIGPIEYAYHLMAQEAKLEVPEAKLFPSQSSPSYFGVRRFDRLQDKPVHMHTISGLLHADHRLPSLDYETIMKATLHLTKNSVECEKQFRAAVFNIFAHNRDDHAKNFSFLMDAKGIWRVSPAYDLTFSSGPYGEHCTTLMNEGKNFTLSHLLKLSEVGGISREKALHIIEEVNLAVSKWPNLAKNVGVTPTSQKMIQTALDHIAKGIFNRK